METLFGGAAGIMVYISLDELLPASRPCARARQFDLSGCGLYAARTLRAVRIGGVEQLMGELAQGRAEELLVSATHGRVLVRLAPRALRVVRVECH